MGIPVPIKSPDQSQAEYVQMILKMHPHTRGGLLCPQRFRYNTDEEYLAAASRWAKQDSKGASVAIAAYLIILIGFLVWAVSWLIKTT